MDHDNQELLDLLDQSSYHNSTPNALCGSSVHYGEKPVESSRQFGTGYRQWSSHDGTRFFPANSTCPTITPGVYEINTCQTRGLFFERIPVVTRGLIRFPQTNIEKVVQEIQKFWDRERIFRQYSLTYKRGIMLWGPPGCHAAGTKVLMHDGSCKPVEEVKVGDLLMGPDSQPRTVYALCQGEEDLYEITPTKGESFIVNASHILSLKRTRSNDTRYPEVMNLKVSDYINLSKCSQRSFKLYRTGVEFNNTRSLPVEPYFLGIWLGDGTASDTSITTADESIVEEIERQSELWNLRVTVSRRTCSRSRTYKLASTSNQNPLRTALAHLGVLDNKHIPHHYLTASREDRLQLLAGLLDTDGGYECSWRNSDRYNHIGHKGYFSITQKREHLATQIAFLARSLGFSVTIKSITKSIKSRGFTGTYFRLHIYGSRLCDIPVRLVRKQASKGTPNKDHLKTGIRSVVPVGRGKYYGFNLSGDHLYLTEDFTVHHNSGKTCAIQLVMNDVVERNGIVVRFGHPSLFTEGMRILREIEPTTPVVVLMEDIDATLQIYSESDVLNILDGVNQIEKVVYLATTNYPERLGPRIINRPSRFDRRFKIGYPNAESRDLYLKHLIGDKGLEHNEESIGRIPTLDKWVADTDGFSFAHLKELFVGVVILGDKYDDCLQTLSSMKETRLSSEDDYRRSAGFTAAYSSGARSTYPQ